MACIFYVLTYCHFIQCKFSRVLKLNALKNYVQGVRAICVKKTTKQFNNYVSDRRGKKKRTPTRIRSKSSSSTECTEPNARRLNGTEEEEGKKTHRENKRKSYEME